MTASSPNGSAEPPRPSGVASADALREARDAGSSNVCSTAAAWAAAIAIAIAVFAAVAPTLAWPEFTGGNENIVVQTALEMRRGGDAVPPKSWLVPSMLGEPRVKKPPLVAWITALAMRQSTVADLDVPARREAAYRALAWQVRWTGLAAGCITLLATFELARVIAGNGAALCATAAAATNLLFMKFMRQSTSDVHLAMWVIIANSAFAHGLLRGRWWIAATLGAAATGMAFLCKGPVALLETILPLAAAIFLTSLAAPPVRAGMQTLRAGAGLVIFLLIALPWFLLVYFTVPGVWHTWFSEVSRQGASTLEADSPLTYLQLVPDLWPWLIFGLLGVVALKHDRALRIAALQIVLPLLVMVLFKDRKDRYLLPMVGPAAALCGAGAMAWWRAAKSVAAWPGVVLGIHVASLVGGAIALIVAGTRLQTAAGGPWFSLSMAGWAIAATLSLTGLWWIAQRRRRGSVIVFTAALMLMLQTLFIFGYSRSEHGRSPFKAMAAAIRGEAPNLPVYDWIRLDRRVDEGLAIYLDRTILQKQPAAISGPAVMILRQLPTEPPPALPPPWQVMTTAKEKKITWWAFVRP